MYGIIITEVITMRVTTSKSKNSESFYITKSYTNAEGKSTSTTIKKLGTLAELSERLGTNRDGVMAWAKGKRQILKRSYTELPQPFASWSNSL